MSAPFFGLKRSDSSVSGAGRRARADLHVHSSLSAGRVCGTGRVGREARDPLAIYREARARGMNLVTLTDIDTLDGCLRIRDRVPDASDLILSEEVVARGAGLAGDLHVLVFGLDERQHREAQRLKGDVEDLVRYLEAERLAFSLGPWVETLPADGDLDRLLPRLRHFRCFEILNAGESFEYNALVARLAQELAAHRGYGVTAGSGVGSAPGVGRVATEAEASGVAEFLEAIRAGRTWPVRARDLTTGGAAILDRLPIARRRRAGRLYGRGARLAARIRAARRRLDQRDVRTFRDKTLAYRGAAAMPPRNAAAGAARGGP